MRDPKFSVPEFAPLAVTCQCCGRELTEDNTACLACDRCDQCAPGTCHECMELRREDEADRMLRLGREARSW